MCWAFRTLAVPRHDARPNPQCPRQELESIMLSGSRREQPTEWDIQRLCARFPRNADTPVKDMAREQSGQVGARLGWWAIVAAAALTLALFLARILRRKSAH